MSQLMSIGSDSPVNAPKKSYQTGSRTPQIPPSLGLKQLKAKFDQKETRAALARPSGVPRQVAFEANAPCWLLTALACPCTKT